MAKILDLRKDINPRVKIIYRTITKRQPWYVEMTKVLITIAVVTTIVWGTSRADNPGNTEVKNFSAIGLVSNLSDKSLSIDHARSSDKTNSDNYKFDISSVQKIETDAYLAMLFSDIKVGDKVIVQGLLDNGVITARRIVDFSFSSSTATTTATTTDETATSTATTTDTTIDTGTDTTIATTTDTLISTSTDNITSITTDDSIATSTGNDSNSNATSSNDTSTTTPDLNNNADISSSTEDVVLPPPPILPDQTDSTSTENNI